MREVDRLSTERYRIPGLQLMENAGAGVVDYLEQNFANVDRQAIVIVCGKGNNGGDGFAIARLLRARGASPVSYTHLVIFFAYIGFDAVSTAAQEAINPKKDMPIGILGSLVICTILYIVVSGLLTGVVSYTCLLYTSRCV